MATKPITQPEYWATDAVYTTGPFIGQPQKVVPPAAFAAEGHRPGALFPTPAEYENSQQYNLTGLARWVFLGSSAGAADAHIVEADSVGRSQLQGLTLTDAVDETVLSINAITTAGNPAVLVTCTTGADAGIDVDIGSADTFAFNTDLGASIFAVGYAVSMTGSGPGCAGIRCSANATTTGIGIDVDHAGSGNAVTVDHTGSGTGLDVNVSAGTGAGIIVDGNALAVAMVVTGGAAQAAIAGVSGNNAIAAIGGAGTGTAIGVTGDGGSGASAAHGVRGTAVHADAMGVYGRTSVSASTTAAGVYGEGRGTGTIGVHGRSDSGYGVIAQSDTTTPAYPAFRIIPQDTDPSNLPTGGELISHGTMNQLRHAAGTSYFGVYQGGTTSCSACLFNGSAAGPFTANSTVIWTSCLTVRLLDSAGNGFYGVTPGAEVTVTIWLTPRTQTAADGTLSLQVLDNTDGGAVILTRAGTGSALTAGYRLESGTTDWHPSLSISFQYAVPNEGDLELEVQIRVGDGAGANVEARDVGCQVWGTAIP